MFHSKSKKTVPDFRKDIPEYPDDEIIAILKQRDHYQPEAARLAIEEAIKRGIIYSEQDLLAEEYRVEELRYSLFPGIKKSGNKQKIRKSIARSMVICGVMPLVFGLVQSNKGNLGEGAVITLLGLAWIYCSAMLINHYRRFLIYVLLIENILGISYIIVKLLVLKRYVFFDFFIPAVLFLLILYALFFMKRFSE